MSGSGAGVFCPQDPPNHRKQTAFFGVDQIIEENRKRRPRGARFDDFLVGARDERGGVDGLRQMTQPQVLFLRAHNQVCGEILAHPGPRENDFLFAGKMRHNYQPQRVPRFSRFRPRDRIRRMSCDDRTGDTGAEHAAPEF